MKDGHELLVALVGGILPAILWLIFWLREDKEHPEPKGLLFFTFIAGMTTVIFVLPFQQLAKANFFDENFLTILWAFTEEIIKYLAVVVVAIRTGQLDEPIDFPIFMIVSALGFAALENTLFLFQPLQLGNTTVSLMTGNLRFLGATLLHAVCSATIGIAIGLSFYSDWFTKKIALVLGILTATALHSLFNFFIIKGNGGNFLTVFGFLWIVTIVVILMFEKLRRMSRIYT